MKYFFLFGILFTSYCLTAQEDAILSGVVVEQNSKFKNGKINYLAYTQIKALGNSQFSDTNGKFTLIFADKPVGNEVRIFAAKQDYEVVNEEVLKHAAVLGRNKPLKIVMCQEGDLYENQMKYYQIANDAVKKEHERLINILKKEGKERNELLLKMQVEFNQEINTVADANELLLNQLQKAEKRAKELADRLVTINLDDQSEIYQNAFTLFLSGNINEAISVLESIDLNERLSKNIQEKSKSVEIIKSEKKKNEIREIQINNDLEQVIFLTELYEIQNDFGNANKNYLIALKHNDRDIILDAKYVDFLERFMRYEKATDFCFTKIEAYTKLINQNQTKYIKHLTFIYRYIGVLFRLKGNLSQSGFYLEKAVENFIFLVEDGDTSLSFLSPISALRELAVTQLENGYFQDAEKNFEIVIRGIEIYCKESESCSKHLISALNSIALLQSEEKKLSEAEKTIKKAISLSKEIKEKKNDEYIKMVVLLSNTLGSIYLKDKSYEKAEEIFIYTTKIYSEYILNEQNSDPYYPEIGFVYFNLGLTQANLEKIEFSIKNLSTALAIFKELYKLDKDVYIINLVMVQLSLSSTYKIKKDFDSAIKYVDDSHALLSNYSREKKMFFAPLIPNSKKWNIDEYH